MLGLSKDDILTRDIEEAIRYINMPFADSRIYKTYGNNFIFGTENQEEINKILNYKDKDVLTPASSGDQYLGAFYYGAKSIEIYDINRFTKYITYLKIASIMVLTYEEFIAFWIPIENGVIKKTFWSKKIFNKLNDTLTKDVAYFWDNVMHATKDKKYGNFILPDAYMNDIDTVMRGMPFYSNEEEYYKLQSLLKGSVFPQFHEMDIRNINEEFNKKYDLVYLSNIIESLVSFEKTQNCYRGPSEDEIEEKYLFRVMPQIIKILNKNGTILVNYRTNSLDVDDLLYSSFLFDVDDIGSKCLDYDFGCNTDLVLTYQPDKRNTRNFFNK